jgi:hypothetical protein
LIDLVRAGSCSMPATLFRLPDGTFELRIHEIEFFHDDGYLDISGIDTQGFNVTAIGCSPTKVKLSNHLVSCLHSKLG